MDSNKEQSTINLLIWSEDYGKAIAQGCVMAVGSGQVLTTQEPETDWLLRAVQLLL